MRRGGRHEEENRDSWSNVLHGLPPRIAYCPSGKLFTAMVNMQGNLGAACESQRSLAAPPRNRESLTQSVLTGESVLNIRKVVETISITPM
jgi:uncharacterized protein (DUF983 family)